MVKWKKRKRTSNKLNGTPLLSSSMMNWSPSISISVEGDSFATFCTLNIKFVTFTTFAAALSNGTRAWHRACDVATFENSGAHRIAAVLQNVGGTISQRAALAYPIDDRPRGSADITSVVHNARSENISPIVVAHVAGRTVLLDGVHRTVAAACLCDDVCALHIVL